MSTSVRRTRLAAGGLLLIFVAAGAGLAFLHARTRPRYALSARRAVAAARADPQDARFLARYPAGNARVIPLDSRLQRVTFFAGARDVLDAAVAPDGLVVSREEHFPGAPQSGAVLANSWWLLSLLSVVFLLSVAVWPLRRLRNLDALALVAFCANVVLVNDGLVAAAVLVSVPLLGYLAARCLRVAASASGGRPHQEPLLEALLARAGAPSAVRMIRLMTAAALLAFVAVTLTSNGESDVAAASLSGATDLLHGVLPYGHIIAGVVHGDTYPLLNYALYIPGAALHPVTEAWSDLSGSLSIAVLAALAATLALAALQRRLAPARPLAPYRTALAWLCFPPVLLSASGGSNDIVLAALLAGTLALASRPGRSTLLLAAAIWAKVVPLILVPLWLCEPARRRGRALAGAIALSAGLLAWLLALGGPGAARAMLDAIAFQFQRGSFDAPWYTFSVQWLQPAVQAALLVCVVWLVARARREPGLVRDPARFAGACGALLLGLQLSGNYWTWSYLPWAFPFVAVALLMDRAQPPSTAARDAAADAALEVRVRRARRELQAA